VSLRQQSKVQALPRIILITEERVCVRSVSSRTAGFGLIPVGAPGFEPGTSSPPDLSSGRASIVAEGREVAWLLALRGFGRLEPAWLREAALERLGAEQGHAGALRSVRTPMQRHW
jgi:hypothetical protein